MQLLMNLSAKIARLSVLFVFLFLALGGSVKAQDTLHLINGKMLAVNLKKIKPFQVEYLRLKERNGRPGTVLRRLSTSEIAEVIYKDGTRDSLLPSPEKANQSGARFLSAQGFNRLGANDAQLYFKGYRDAAAGTFLATFLGSPAIGLFVAVPASIKQPSPKRFTYPNLALLDNTDYVEGYAKQAHKMKATKVWVNWGAGTVVTFVAYFVVKSLFYR